MRASSALVVLFAVGCAARSADPPDLVLLRVEADPPPEPPIGKLHDPAIRPGESAGGDKGLTETVDLGDGVTVVRKRDKSAPTFVVQVLARQHEWLFRSAGPGEDGKPAGFDRDGGKWCLYSDTLVVPMGAKVVLHLASKDVAHAFFVQELRLKADIQPGELTIAELSAGRFAEKPVPAGAGRELSILCAEYCGAGHAKMTAKLLVLRPADFAEWTKAMQAARDASIKADGFPRDPRRTPAETKGLWAGFPHPNSTP